MQFVVNFVTHANKEIQCDSLQISYDLDFVMWQTMEMTLAPFHSKLFNLPILEAEFLGLDSFTELFSSRMCFVFGSMFSLLEFHCVYLCVQFFLLVFLLLISFLFIFCSKLISTTWGMSWFAFDLLHFLFIIILIV